MSHLVNYARINFFRSFIFFGGGVTVCYVPSLSHTLSFLVRFLFLSHIRFLSLVFLFDCTIVRSNLILSLLLLLLLSLFRPMLQRRQMSVYSVKRNLLDIHYDMMCGLEDMLILWRLRWVYRFISNSRVICAINQLRAQTVRSHTLHK